MQGETRERPRQSTASSPWSAGECDRSRRLWGGALRGLAQRALESSGVASGNATAVATALVRADMDCISSHGVALLPQYAAHARCGRVDGRAVPTTSVIGSAAIRVDAHHGFAYPAIATANRGLLKIAGTTGVAAAAICRTHHSGVLGHHVEDLADEGLAALMVCNSPRTIAAPGGTVPLFGTNPIAFACPRHGHPPLVIDLSMGVVTQGRINLAAQRGTSILEGWALDKNGQPTTNPVAALHGTLAAFGGGKGAALAMIIDLVAGLLTGSNLSSECSSFFHDSGAPLATGAMVVAFDPIMFGGTAFADRVARLCTLIASEPNVRLPGDRRLAERRRQAAEGITISTELLIKLQQMAERHPL
ncbi:MAG: Ldh family oxidoreductase [Acetobacteraceae bacterium]